jgi:peroxiredoxin/mono/diheme cytochrome c family protein
MVRVLFAALCLAGLVYAAEKPEAGKPVPAVALINLDGQPTDLAAARGKAATVIVFVSFDCPVSTSYSATLNELAKTYAPKGVAVIAVCPTDDPREQVAKAAAPFKFAVPVLLDPKKEAAAAVGVSLTPEAVVLDAGGVVRYRGRIDDAFSARLKRNPAVTSHDLTDALDAVLAGTPVKEPVTKAVGCPIDFDAAAAKAGPVTYHKDVAPILAANCAGCHRQGEIGPFSLTSYKQARRWADDIKTYTANRAMPPWMPHAGLPMKGERKLTEKEIATLAAWADAGAPEGDPKDANATAAAPADEWRHGPPDLILTPSEAFHLAADGKDMFRCYVLPTGLTEDTWVVGYDVKPGSPRVVHHTLHFFDTTGQARELEQKQQLKDAKGSPADHGPGYSSNMGVGFIARPKPGQAGPVFGGLGGWAPGQAPQFVPQGAGWLLPKGSDFIIQTHYHRDGSPAEDRTRVGLYFAKKPVEKPWQTVVVAGLHGTERIPAGDSHYVAKGTVYLHREAVLHSVLPHMHLLGKRVKVTMTPPGGDPVVLIDIPAWDYKWQETYWFREPIHAKVGTKLEVEAVFDNSADNPSNPTRPPREVKVGEETTDEMLYAFIGATSPKSPSERIRTYALPPPELGTAAAPAKGQMTPVLAKRLGTWSNAVALKPVLGEATKLTAKETVTTAYDGAFIQVRSVNDGDGNELIELATFDPERKQYRMWTYNSQGATIEWAGTWDEKAVALTWTTTFQGGYAGTLKWTFPSADRVEQEIVIKSAGFPVMTITTTETRAK